MKTSGMLRRTVFPLLVFFAMAIASPAQTFTTLLSFDGSNGADPQYMSLIQASNGDLYGTTYSGGAKSAGTIFQITPLGKLTTLYNFCGQTNCTDGQAPDWGLVKSASGTFYGTTVEGGVKGHCLAAGCGTVFEITPSGALTTLYSFCAQTNCSDGQSPGGTLLWTSSGALYGTTELGGVTKNGCNGSCGTAFTISPAGQLTTLHSFERTDGSEPLGGLVQGQDGNLYGTTFNGGANNTCPTGGCGTVFKMTSGGSVTTLYSFCAQTKCADGATPYAGLVQGTDGNLYGTTVAGGETTSFWIDGAGTIFKITPDGELATLHTFRGTDGASPTAALVQASDGNFYGTTQYGGTSSLCAGGCGTIFKITPMGTLTTLYSFCLTGNPCPDGYFPTGGLAQATTEEFYGTTGGGIYGEGTLFTLAVFPTIKVSPTSLSFGDEALNETSAAKTVTLKNTGTFSLTLNSIAINGDFAKSANTCGVALSPGKTCKISVNFTPTALGPQGGTLSIVDTSAGSPQTVQFSGIGVAPPTLTPSSHTFPKTKVGEISTAYKFTLKNNLPTTLTGISYSTAGPFAVSTSTCGSILDSEKSCAISITFSPVTTGPTTGTLTVNDSAGNRPQTARLSGTGD